ncbi:la related protein 7 [Calliopsis andreniformis]|uniref:la related protein 7 n=1 Tax=Calliopsis andreniformis TaxID=337506 RepID=UPI003FCEE53B
MVMEEQQSDMELDSERVPVPQVQKSVENSRANKVNKNSGVSRGKPRLRKKALNAAILKQMEFYFSDANLSKDRFLSNLIKDDPYVDLSVFLRFNKIRDLTSDVNRINKALQASEILSLSEDGTKVCRTTPVEPKKNADDCTIYVQNLPPDADHEILSSLFSQYGPVVYVSVPRYKHNRKIKGFAFIEFDTPESARKCMKAFQKKGCVLPSHTAPNELLSITTFDNAEKDVTLLGRKKDPSEEEHTADKELENVKPDTDSNLENREEGEQVTADNSEIQENKNKDTRKRLRIDSEHLETADTENQVDAEMVKKKKSRLSTDVSNNETKHANEKEENTSKKLIKGKESVPSSEEIVDNGNKSEERMTEEEDDTNEKKKKRKRKRRSKTEDVTYSLGLQVMTKKDWKHLRNKYLELQRSKMKQLKQHLRKTKWNQWSNYEKNKTEKEENDEKEKTTKQDSANVPRFSFVPGVIVKIEMDKPCSDPKGLKMELKGNNSVKYIDVDEGSFVAYVRCDTAEAAQTFAQRSDEEKHMTILEGEEEKMYWNKISEDREKKLGNKIRPKQRGRNKLLKKAEKVLGKHIKFDEV